ncbi:Cation Diffusion Facilitator (CDF) protein [Phytophthora megakarya]|uniref:Cation Diffusion Facilitator (CDF) protein n=1 Tax=Phytophthora megakarya TaxID=4795 RepID=A0A225VKQ7_9STRA|nr:Cation Diffusion Facilitator (CDF) protein [Phytophthora megakarya]
MDLTTDGSLGSRGGVASAATWASCSLLLLVLLRSLLLHTTRDFSVLAQLLLLQLALVSISWSNSRRGRRLDAQGAILAGARRLAKLYVTVQALRHFGLLFTFLLQHCDVLLQQLKHEYGALLLTLVLLGAALGLQWAHTSPVDSESPLSVAAAMIFAAVLAFLTPESVAHAQQIANDRASADGGVMSEILVDKGSVEDATGVYVHWDHTEMYLGTYRSSAEGSMTSSAAHVLQVLWAKRASRQMLIFLSVNVAFMFVELGVGLYTNSLGLMGDAGHMLFDNGALVIGLAASYIGQLPPDTKFTYGYGRVEVLSGFLNSLLLLVVSFHLLTEAAQRFMDPPEVTTDHLLLTSTAGLIVNLVGLVFFHDHVHGHSHSHGEGKTCGGGHNHSHGNSHHQAHGEDASESDHHAGNSNMYGVYLHVMADTLGSVGVIISSILIQLYEWHVADSASSALISLLILGSTLPLLRDTTRQLLQGAPQELEGSVNGALQEVQVSVPGVERITQWNIWHHAGDMCVATLHLQVSPSADEQRVLQQTHAIFRRHAQLDRYLSVQISKPQSFATMGVGAEQATVMDSWSAGHGHSHNHSHGHSHGHSHNHGHSHGHSHGVEPPMESVAALSPQPRHLYPHQPTVTTMSTHENPVSDDFRYITTPEPPLKANNAHSHDHTHNHEFHFQSTSMLVSPQNSFPQTQQRHQQVNTRLSGAHRG